MDVMVQLLSNCPDKIFLIKIRRKKKNCTTFRHPLCFFG